MNTEQLRKEFEAWYNEDTWEDPEAMEPHLFDAFSAGYQAAAKLRDELIEKLEKFLEEFDHMATSELCCVSGGESLRYGFIKKWRDKARAIRLGDEQAKAQGYGE